MKSLVALLAVFALASPTLAAALLNDPTIENQIHHGGQTRVRVDAWGVAHPIAYDPRAILPASMDGGAVRCPALRSGAPLQTAKAPPPLIAA